MLRKLENEMMEDGILPHGIGSSMLENLEEITNSTYAPYEANGAPADPRDYKYGQATGLFNGLVGTETYATYTEEIVFYKTNSNPRKRFVG